MINLHALLSDYRVDYKPRTNSWLLVNCPFCSDNSYHGALSTRLPVFTCWRDGRMPYREALCKILDVPSTEIDAILNLYSDGVLFEQEERLPERDITVELPIGSGDLTEIHKKYLQARRFDPEHIESQYGVKGTTHLSVLPFRLIIPVYFNGVLCSWTSRDVTGKAKNRYYSCEPDNERICHKDLIYNWDNCDGIVLLCEGQTDVWRLGNGACCTFGLSFTDAQVELLKQKKKIWVLFDNETLAKQRADELSRRLAFSRTDVEIIRYDFEGDPGDFDDSQVKQVREFVFS